MATRMDNKIRLIYNNEFGLPMFNDGLPTDDNELEEEEQPQEPAKSVEENESVVLNTSPYNINPGIINPYDDSNYSHVDFGFLAAPLQFANLPTVGQSDQHFGASRTNSNPFSVQYTKRKGSKCYSNMVQLLSPEIVTVSIITDAKIKKLSEGTRVDRITSYIRKDGYKRQYVKNSLIY